MTATLFLGIWGAGVSTILALAKIIPEWPIVSIAPAVNPEDTPPSVTLIVFNPARRPLSSKGTGNSSGRTGGCGEPAGTCGS